MGWSEPSCQQQMLLVNLLIAEHLLCSRRCLDCGGGKKMKKDQVGRKEGAGQICLLLEN